MEPEKAAADLCTIYLAYRSLAAAAVPGLTCALGGRFLLLTRVGNETRPERTMRALAARIAGAATLLIIENAGDGRAALQSGVCDFLVSSLDEALRILKNELRRKTPITVGLQGSPSRLLADCVERGVQPDLIEEPHVIFENRGAIPVRWRTTLRKGEHGVCWFVSGPLHSHAELDSVALHAIRAGAGNRARWLAVLPGVLGRPWQRYRFLPMTSEELERFRELARGLPAAPAILCDGKPLQN